jgi:hypothetical protein
MGLQNVHDQKSDSRPVLIVKLIESGNLPPEWWSGVAAEHQNHRLLRTQGGELDLLALIQLQ